MNKEKRIEVKSISATVRKAASPFSNRVKPVSNAFSIVRFLTGSHASATVTQIARQLSLNPSTCFNILRTLVWEGLVDFDERTKSYSVGVGLVQLAQGAVSESSRIAAVKPRMHEIANRYRVTLLLWRRLGTDRMVLVLVENSSADMQIHVRIGQRLPFLLGATGRAVAAHLGLTKQQLKEKFRTLRWSRRVAFEEYWRDVQAAAAQGWAVDNENFASGVTTVAAPVFDRHGEVSHSIVAIMFRGQHDPSAVKRIAQDLISLSNELRSALS